MNLYEKRLIDTSAQTCVISGSDNVTKAMQAAFANSKLRWSMYSDSVRPSIIGLEFYSESFAEMKKRGVRLRWIAEITRDNVIYCKEIMKIFELRHLDGAKGNFALGDSEYIANTSPPDIANVPSAIVYSNLPEVVRQQEYLFETLWEKATPAEVKIFEIEDGLTPERTEVLYGEENANRIIFQTLSNTRNRFSALISSISPSVATGVDVYKRAYIDMNKRGVKIRLITDIAKDNLACCKELMEFLELKHMEGLKGNFAVSENEYLANALMQETQPLPEVIYSNVSEIVEQNQYLFDTFWSRAEPAEERIREIQEGVVRYESRLLEDPEEILDHLANDLVSFDGWCICTNANAMHVTYNSNLGRETYEEIYGKYKEGRRERIRWICYISKADIEIVKFFLNLGVEIRHVKNMPPMNFSVSDNSYNVTNDDMQGGKTMGQLLTGNNPHYVKHFRRLFDQIWKDGIDADTRIRDIEEGRSEEEIQVIHNPVEIVKTFSRLVNSAVSEIMLVLPSPGTVHRQAENGILHSLEMAARGGVKVRILAPQDSETRGIISKVLYRRDSTTGHGRSRLVFRQIEEPLASEAMVTILVVDNSACLTVEVKDDTKESYVHAIGLATFLTSKSKVLSYISLFETLWRENEMREREAQARREQEFAARKEERSRREAQLLQDVLTHDIRNYNQVSRLSAELLREELKHNQGIQVLTDALLHAIDGSTTLVERAKKLGKIISEENAKLYPVNLLESLQRSLVLIKNAYPKKDIRETVDIQSRPNSVLHVLADDLLEEVFVNLFSNSAKYGDGDRVDVEIRVSEVQSIETEDTEGLLSKPSGLDEVPSSDRTYWRVTIADTGRGIPENVKSKIFSRYFEGAKGTGLGLSIVSALVVDRYGGKVRIADRTDGKRGTAVDIWLPKCDKNPG